jgi:membrane protein YqaA with SNARE-associated domain
MWLITNISSMEQFQTAQGMFIKYGVLIIIIAAISPIPYKLMAMCAGFIGFPTILFLGVSAIFRTGRFAIVGFLLWRFQEMANAMVKKYFWPLTLLAVAAACAGVRLMYLV